jgi:hypothetical protein
VHVSGLSDVGPRLVTDIAVNGSRRIGSTDWRRLRFVALIAMYGGALGAAAVIVNLLSRTPFFDEPQHLGFEAGLIIYGGGAVTGIFVGALVAAAVQFEGHQWPLGIRLWLICGLVYGLVFALSLAGLFAPLSNLVLDFYQGALDPIEVLQALSHVAISWPIRAIIDSALLLYSAAGGGLLFGAGAWGIDRFHTSTHPTTSRYGSWGISLLLGLMVLFFSLLAPPTLLARFG